MWKKLIFAVLSLIFLLFLVFVPTASDLSRYNLPASEYQMLFISSEAPVVVIWLLAFYSYSRLKRYANSIQDSPDSVGFHGLARGCQWLALGLPVAAVITLVLAVLASHNPTLLPTSIIISNYVSVLFPILAFSTMSDSSHNLMQHYGLRRHAWWQNYREQLLFLLVGITYGYLILSNLSFGSLNATANQYFLPLWLLIISLIIPYLYAWFLGLMTAFDIVALARRTPGVIYRQGLQLIAGGLVTVIISLMAVQYLRSQLPNHQHSDFNHLIWTYSVYIICIVGFVLLLSGISKLKRIEEV